MTPDRLRIFQGHLGVKDEAQAARLWRFFETKKFEIAMTEKGRSKIRDATKARKDLEVIASAAKRLSRLLRVEPIAKDLLDEGDADMLDQDGHFNPSDEQLKAYYEAPRVFCDKLTRIAKMAEKYSKDEEELRATNWLPPVSQSNENVYSLHLWPELFHFWKRANKRLASTPNGPLHRFLKFVHDEMGYPEPSASTLRDAIKRYDGRAAKNDDAPL